MSETNKNRWVHPLCRPLPVDRNDPFILVEDESIATVDKEGFRISRDEGKTWSEAWPVDEGINPDEPASFQMVKTKDGTIVIIYLDFTTRNFSWDEEKGEPKEDCRLELWAIRSTDGGRTWSERQKLLGGYNANFFGFIQTSKGRLVATVEHCVNDPGRWLVCSFISDDEGKSWRKSNFLDLGGHGHHDGALEPTVAELGNGRLLMFIRTNLDRFWQAFSDDGGRYWRIILPSDLDASSSPGYLLRLRSGRLVLVWNRLNPEGGMWSRSEPGPASEERPSWYREELSLAFSENDGESWSKPVVIARQREGQLSYPYIFERRPGELWVIAGFTFVGEMGKSPMSSLRLRIDEQEFLEKAGD